MPIRPCPLCQQATPRLLDASSQRASVNYYRCASCGHVWHVSKSDPDGAQTTVTRDHSIAHERQARLRKSG